MATCSSSSENGHRVTTYVECKVYGGESGTEAQKEYYKAFREKYSGIYNTQEEWCERVVNNGYIRMPTGMVFRWPDRKVNRKGRLNVKSNVYNFPVQYLATGEIIPIWCTKIWEKMYDNNMQSFIVNTVHDSIVAEVCPEEEDLYCSIVHEAQEEVYDYLADVYAIKFNIPLEAEIKIGDRWGTGKKQKFVSNPPFV